MDFREVPEPAKEINFLELTLCKTPEVRPFKAPGVTPFEKVSPLMKCNCCKLRRIAWLAKYLLSIMVVWLIIDFLSFEKPILVHYLSLVAKAS